jgi:hypothetical protein
MQRRVADMEFLRMLLDAVVLSMMGIAIWFWLTM